MKINNKLLTTETEIIALAESIREAGIVALDTEFIRENTFFPTVELIQVATATESWIIDARIFKKGYPPGATGGFDPALNAFIEILKDPKVLKVLHAAQGDQECFYTSFGALASPSFDTAIGASLCGMGDNIGLSKLLNELMGLDLKKGHARTNWSVRPLPEQLLEYAHSDVIHLIEAYEMLKTQLEKSGRYPWSLQLASQWEKPEAFEIDVDGMAQKTTKVRRLDPYTSAVYKDLLKWREKRCRELNIPRRWLAEDSVMLDLAQVKPKDVDHLLSFRGLHRGEVKQNSELLIDLIKNAKPDANPPQAQRKRALVPTNEEALLLPLVQTFVTLLSEKHQIAARHLITSSSYLEIIRHASKGLSGWVAQGALSKEAADMIGKDLELFLNGKIWIGVKDGKASIQTQE